MRRKPLVSLVSEPGIIFLFVRLIVAVLLSSFTMPIDELAEHLKLLQHDDSYRVESVLKKTNHEETQKVYFVGAQGAEQGPYVRKYIDNKVGLGETYEKLFMLQKSGKRFQHLPLIFDFYILGDKNVIIMEFIPGETLQEVVYRCDPSESLAYDVFPRLCDAVLELHEGFDQPIIHRDLKPSNIMLTQQSLMLIDFGIARTYKHENDSDTSHFGTNGYAPPEQFGYGQTDVRSDVFALGGTLYFCLTEKNFNRREFEQGTEFIPSKMGEIIKKATEFSPEDRFKNVEELKASFVAGTQTSSQGDLLKTDYSAAYLSGTPAKQGSKILGIIWDVLLLLALLAFLIVGVAMSVNPDSDSSSAAFSLGKRTLQYAAAILFFFVPLAYFLSDRRPLKRLFPIFRRMNLVKDIVLICLSFVMLFLVFGISLLLR